MMKGNEFDIYLFYVKSKILVDKRDRVESGAAPAKAFLL